MADRFETRVRRITEQLLGELDIPKSEVLGYRLSASGDNCQVQLQHMGGVGPTVFRDNDDEVVEQALRAVFSVFVRRVR